MGKAQVVGQIFIYIMTIVVVGMIVIMGYWAINSTISRGCQVEKATFKDRLSTIVSKDISFGSVNHEVLRAPCGYETICFVDSSLLTSRKGAISIAQFINCSNTIIGHTIFNNGTTNIFLANDKNVIGIGHSPHVKLPYRGNCSCISARNNNFYLTMEGDGSRAMIYPTGTG